MSDASSSAVSVEYKDKETEKFARDTIEQINYDLQRREEASIIFNGIPYTDAYEYNQRKAINYSPAKGKDDREVSAGIVHEKIVSFVAIFLKYVFKHDIKVYKDGALIPRMGDVYELGIQHSRKLENFKLKVALIYWELFSQGDAFVLEDWMVRNVKYPNAFTTSGELVTGENMEYTLEFLEGLSYEEGDMVQERRAESVVMDGRRVILGDPECNILQDQPRITLEESFPRGDAAAMFDSLTMWDQVPAELQSILSQSQDKLNTLFNNERFDATKEVLVHRYFDKEHNKFNIFVNGVMMLPKDTPLTIFYPRGNYPISQLSCERVTGSAYSRSIPAKTKFNADYLDWILKKMAYKFEQGLEPAVFAQTNVTLTADMFKPRQVTHGVSRQDFEKVDPDNKGVTVPEFNFFSTIKEIIETQTVNQTTSGEISGNATATEIATVDQNQQQKLGYLLDAMMNGWYDMAYRRCETIESKYTLVEDQETTVDGRTIQVYTNFTFMRAGIQNMVIFDDQLPEYGKEESDRIANELFMKSEKSRKGGQPLETFLVDPMELRSGELFIDITIKPEKLKDSQLQLIQMFDELNQTLGIFGRSDQGGAVNIEEVKKDYLEVSGKSDDFFVASDLAQNPELMRALQEGKGQSYNMGTFGKPRISDAVASEVSGKQ